MNKTLVSAIGLLALAGLMVPASAADLRARPITKAPVAAPPAIYNWTGFYGGLNAGYSWGDTDVDYVTPFDAVFLTLHPKSFIGGGQIGYNFQTGSIVYGLEADLAYRHDADRATFLFGSTPTAGNPFGSVAGDNTIFTTEQNWLGTVRGRVGFAWSNWLVYGTGGLAIGNVKHSVRETLVAPDQDRFRVVATSNTELGWTAGAGVEVGFAGGWSAGLEYLFVDLGDRTIAQGAITNLVVFPADTTTFSDTSHVLRFKLNYRFGFGGPARAGS